MTQDNHFKKQVRARMKLTGETYSQARKHLYDDESKSLAFYRSKGLIPANSETLANLTVDHLFSGTELSSIKKELKSANGGIILVIGQTAVGKTATMHALLNSYAEGQQPRVIALDVAPYHDISQKSVEHLNPVRTPVTSHSDLSANIESSLRLRPDAILVGEICLYDEPPIAAFSQNSGDGQKLFSTVHSNSFVKEVIWLAQSLKGDFSKVSIIVEQRRYQIKSRTFYLRSVVVFTEGVRAAVEAYIRHGDESELLLELEQQGVQTMDKKVAALREAGIYCN